MRKSEDEISKYKAEYKRIVSIPCAYFSGEKIYFNNNGFNHLLRKGKNPRLSIEQTARLNLIQYAQIILESTKAHVEYRKSKRPSTTAHFWGFNAHIGNERIKLIVRQINDGPKHFFSIFPIKR